MEGRRERTVNRTRRARLWSLNPGTGRYALHAVALQTRLHARRPLIFAPLNRMKAVFKSSTQTRHLFLTTIHTTSPLPLRLTSSLPKLNPPNPVNIYHNAQHNASETAILQALHQRTQFWLLHWHRRGIHSPPTIQVSQCSGKGCYVA